MKNKNIDTQLSAAHLQAAINGDLNTLKSSVTTGNVNQLFQININNQQTGEVISYNVTLLDLAAERGHTEMVRWLKDEKNANANTKGINGNSPFMAALANRHPETAAVLLDSITEIDYQNPAGETPISMACFYGTLETVQALIDRGANPRIAENNGCYPINYTALRGDENMLRVLAGNGADVNAQEADGTTPLITSIVKGYTKITATLLELGANIHVHGKNGFFPIHYSALHGNIEALKLLATKDNIDRPAIADHRATPLYLAAQQGHTDMVYLLHGYGAESNLLGANAMTPLYTAIIHRHPETAAALLEVGAKVNIPNILGFFPIHAATEFGDLNTLTLLRSQGWDVNLKALNAAQQTPMHIAFLRAQTEVIDYLLTEGADINAQTTEGKTPLHLLLANQGIETDKKLQIVQQHLSEFDLSMKDLEGKTVYDYAQEYCADCAIIAVALTVAAIVEQYDTGIEAVPIISDLAAAEPEELTTRCAGEAPEHHVTDPSQ